MRGAVIPLHPLICQHHRALKGVYIMPKVTHKQMAEEAAKRMKILKMKPHVIEAFLNNNQMAISSDYGFDLMPPQYLNLVIRRGNVFAYHVLLGKNSARETRQTILYVSPTPDLWEEERRMLKKGYAIALEKNFSEDMTIATTQLVQVEPGRKGSILRKDRYVVNKPAKKGEKEK